MFENASVFRRLFWFFAVATAVAMFGWMTNTLITEYVEYPTTTTATFEGRPNAPMPWITICNQNAYKFRSLMNDKNYLKIAKGMMTKSDAEDFAENVKRLGEKFADSESDGISEGDQMVCFLNDHAAMEEKVFKQLSKYLDDNPLEPKHRHFNSMQSMVLDCKFKGKPCWDVENATDKDVEQNPQIITSQRVVDMDVMPTKDYGDCVTFKPSTLLSNRLKRSGNTPSSRLELLLNVDADEFWPAKTESPGLRAVVHPANTIPDMTVGVSLDPGTLAEVAIVTREFKRTPYPYGSHCDIVNTSNIKRLTSTEVDARKAPAYLANITHASCQALLVAENVINTCGCYIASSSTVLTLDQGNGAPLAKAVTGSKTDELEILVGNAAGKIVKICSATAKVIRDGKKLPITERVCSSKSQEIIIEPGTNCVSPCTETDHMLNVKSTSWPYDIFGRRSVAKKLSLQMSLRKTPIPNNLKPKENVTKENTALLFGRTQPTQSQALLKSIT